MSSAIEPAVKDKESTGVAHRDAATPVALFKELGPTAYALLAASLYVCGFLVLNANLAKHGIVDFEFVDARYILAGSSFAFFLVCFYLFAGRAVLHTPKWLQEEIDHYQKLGLKPKWNVVVFANSLVFATFACCLSAGLFSLTAFGDVETAFFYAVLAGAFFVLYTLDVTNLDLRIPRTHLVISLVVRLAATIAFFANPESGMLVTVFMLYLAMFFFVNLALDSIKRHGATPDRLSYSAIYALVLLLTVAVAFGATVFGSVSTKIGGARPQTIVAALSEDAAKSIPTEVLSGAPHLVTGKLIHQTDRFSYVEVSQKTIRLRSPDIVALVVTPERPQSFWSNYIRSAASAPSTSSSGASSPNPSLERTATGNPLGPLSGAVNHPSSGPSGLPASAPQLKR
ncbi:hypothetical protein [Roseateles albus]|uniref:Uncharacterized protein n=1 Tax=Roseateles albus TaxID=2987525 RepID=A0ABT5KHV6_9BURK|nr:hypothetical protein [Roseateles albus]MDC8773440.1 hypothetical protein [Roseateles albus]